MVASEPGCLPRRPQAVLLRVCLLRRHAMPATRRREPAAARSVTEQEQSIARVPCSLTARAGEGPSTWSGANCTARHTPLHGRHAPLRRSHTALDSTGPSPLLRIRHSHTPVGLSLGSPQQPGVARARASLPCASVLAAPGALPWCALPPVLRGSRPAGGPAPSEPRSTSVAGHSP
jgi:hypothetical protein